MCKDYENKDGGCRYYMDGGACSLPKNFMCEAWMEAQPGGKKYPAIKKVLDAFPGSYVVETRPIEPNKKTALEDLFG